MNQIGTGRPGFTGPLSRASAWALALAVAGCVGGGGPAAAPGAAGDVVRSLTVAGVQRSYLLHVPAARADAAPAPVVLLLHGGYGSGAGIGRIAGDFSEFAERRGFIAVYPDSKGHHWNDGRDSLVARSDDVAFIAALLDAVAAEHRVDTRRVYAAGLSNGGMMTLRLACELSNRFAAVATVAANMPAALVANCAPARAVPLVMFSGTADPLMPYLGGVVAGRAGGRVLSAPDTALFWARKNGVAEVPQEHALPDTDAGDGTTTDLLAHAPGGHPGAVALYRINDGGHTWPGGTPYLPARFIGKAGRDFSANEVLWAFFARHTLP